MQFIETYWDNGVKRINPVEFSDARAAEQHADAIFQKAIDVVSMHCICDGNKLLIYFSKSRKTYDHRSQAQKIVYKLESKE